MIQLVKLTNITTNDTICQIQMIQLVKFTNTNLDDVSSQTH